MTNIVEAKAFYEALKHLSILTRRAKFGLLDEICVRFTEDACTMTATDIANVMQVELPADGDSFSFVFADTAKVIKACKFFSGRLSFELKGEGKDMRLTMSCGEKSADFPVNDARDYPWDWQFEAVQQYSCSADTLLNRMKRVKYAAGPYSTNHPEMEGFQFAGQYLYCIDGYRLAVSEDESLSVSVPFVIPQIAMNCLKEMGDGELRIEVGLTRVRLRCRNLTALLKRILCDPAATPAKYLPRSPGEVCTVNRQEYLHELGYLKECAGTGEKAVVLFENGDLTLQQKDASYRTRVNMAGECRIIYAFEAEKMCDALKQFSGSDTVEISAYGKSTPIVLTAKGSSDTALLVPHRYPKAA